jgi:hypothetical protein
MIKELEQRWSGFAGGQKRFVWAVGIALTPLWTALFLVAQWLPSAIVPGDFVMPEVSMSAGKIAVFQATVVTVGLALLELKTRLFPRKS